MGGPGLPPMPPMPPGFDPFGQRRGGRRARRGDVRTAALLLIAEEPRNGYQIIQTLSERSDGAWRVSSGAIYPALSQLEDEGLIRATEVEGRKAFEITETGLEALERNKPAVDAVFARLDEAAESSPRASPRVARAMQNLAMAVRMKLSSERPSEAQVDAIVAAIDEAVAKIEKA